MSALLSLTGRLLWPSLPIKIIWVLLLAASVLSLISQQPKVVIVPLACLLLLIFCMPLQFMQLRHNRSWLLLPHFKPLSRYLLLGVTLLVGTLSGGLLALAGKAAYMGAQFGILAFASLILPCLVFGNLRPLLVNSACLVVVVSSNVLNFLPLPEPVAVISILTLINAMLLVWFYRNWLKPVAGKNFPGSQNCQTVYSWLLQFTRKPASLGGTLLCGQGDSWQASLLRNLAYCWYLPGLMLIWSFFLNNGSFVEAPILRAIFVLFPGFLLTDQLINLFRRVRRAWLHLPVPRHQLFTLIEQQALRELTLATLVVSPLLFWLLPTTTAVAMLLLWPALMATCLYLGWRLINIGVFWSGSIFVCLNITTVAALTLCWQHPQYLVLLAAFFSSLALKLRGQVKLRCETQNWAVLKIQTPQHMQVRL